MTETQNPKRAEPGMGVSVIEILDFEFVWNLVLGISRRGLRTIEGRKS